MIKYNCIAVVLVAIIFAHGIAYASYTGGKNNRRWAVQEDVYKRSQELYKLKKELHLQREEDRRREQYRQAVEERKNMQKGSGVRGSGSD